MKDLQHLRRELEPKAAFHRDRDLKTLKAHVRQVDSLIRRLPCIHEVRLDLDLAVKGIITEAVLKKQKQPQCCFDDDTCTQLDF